MWGRRRGSAGGEEMRGVGFRAVFQQGAKQPVLNLTYVLLRADRNGWIEPGRDGEQLWVEVERR